MTSPQVRLAEGIVAGDRAMTGIHQLNVFRGIPYAAPPIGESRWREPQRLAPWIGVREAKQFGPRCMQMDGPSMTFRSPSMSEDCLYLNVWAPAKSSEGTLPVLVYFHGGGFAFGDGSEPRYDGAHLAGRGMIVVTVNYRLGVFGFLMHPEAERDSEARAAGNYGLLDQQAALRWVRENIARFGGDSAQVTIGGETTGAMSVSAHMASTSSRGLFARAIGESGGAFAPNAFWTRKKAERAAQAFATRLGANSLDDLREMSAEKVQQAMGTYKDPQPFLWPSIDGHFLTDTPAAIFEAGRQAAVPLLVGSNSQENHFKTIFGPHEPTPENWALALGTIFRNELPEAHRLYPGNSADEILRSAAVLANDLTMGHSTWRWMDLHRQTGRAPVYFYLFAHRRPPAVAAGGKAIENEDSTPVTGAARRSEIVYVFGNLDQDPRFRWTTDDYAVSRIFSGYIEQFVKSGTPNGASVATAQIFSEHVDRLVEAGAPGGAGGARTNPQTIGRSPADLTPPQWPAVHPVRDGLARQVIDTDTRTTFDTGAERHALVQRMMQARTRN
ncbi:carboxylesterase/lipase family protein [Trinickia dinghuensis]|nr:carboxylesterase family protein [Trinickia dinghuensis]